MKDKTKETKWRKKFKKSVQALSELKELSITSNFIDLVCNNFDYFMGEATKSLLKEKQKLHEAEIKKVIKDAGKYSYQILQDKYSKGIAPKHLFEYLIGCLKSKYLNEED